MSARSIRQVCHLDMEAICRFLRTAFPTSTALNVECMTGISAGTVENWIRARSRPSAEHLGALVSAFGPQFVAAAFPSTRAWTGRAVRAERLTAIAEELAAMVAAE